ncbi:hypothetical protein FGG08_004878 [Glutinoglossum americanum]|uniref:ATP-dependent bile acid permease n=1 Tax=Glutinoglossum americanum TaxID=1670608 RepID=A0A9P8KWL3_9PEZI|nr:hypothetical protein FGG08_004878 [Glutinoglossum americanum]
MAIGELLPIIAGGGGAGIVFFITLPSILRLLRSQSPRGYSALSGDYDGKCLYEDEGGTATVESEAAYSDRMPKIFIYVTTLLGFSASVVSAILSTVRPTTSLPPRLLITIDWINFASWFLLVIQAADMSVERSSVRRYDNGILGALSACILILVIFAQNGIIARRIEPTGMFTDAEMPIKVHANFGAVQLGAAVFDMFASVSLQRRPDVFLEDGRLVDQQFTVSAFGRYTFGWCDELLRLAQRKPLDMVDLPRPDHITRAKNLQEAFLAVKRGGPLWKLVFLAHWPAFVQQWSLTLIQSVLQLSPQFTMFKLLRILELRTKGHEVGLEAWVWVLGLGSCLVVNTWINDWLYWVSSSRLSVPVKVQLSAIIFQKAMRRKDVKGGKKVAAKTDAAEFEGVSEATLDAGKKGAQTELGTDGDDAAQESRQSTTNLITIDCGRVSGFCYHNNFVLSGVLELVISVAFLLNLIGWKPLLAGLTAFALVMPLAMYITKKYSATQDALMKIRDDKMAVVKEALQGLRQIKFSALERQWQAKIGKVRAKELDQQCGLVDAKVSVGRIQAYLDGPEKLENTTPADTIYFQDASIAWPQDVQDEDQSDRFILKNVNIAFPQGELSVVSGKTGSGKSLLLASILGECDLLEGAIGVPKPPPVDERFDHKATANNWIIPSSIAFVAQVPWIENATIKDNILFGLPFDAARYKKTLSACALEKDLDTLIDGELTEIGADGINLSGGQRWRVTLARALYSRAGILVLDDIFSAVDANVGHWIFENALTGELGRGRTRILITHHATLCLPRTSYAVTLGHGTVEHAGRVDELKKSGSLKDILRLEAEAEAAAKQTDEPATGDAEEPEIKKLSRRVTSDINADAATKPKPKKFVEDEHRETGGIGKAIYLEYLRASGGLFYWAACLIVCIGISATTLLESWWMKIWTSSGQQQMPAVGSPGAYRRQTQFFAASGATTPVAAADGGNGHRDLAFYLGVYLALNFGGSLVSTLKYVYVFTLSIRASRRLFEAMTYAVLRTPLRWIDTVPVGRILNRFTSDFSTVDSELAFDLSYLIMSVLHVVAVTAAAVFVSPYIIFSGLALLAAALYIARLYLAGARELRRIASNARSPIIEQFRSALTGVGTIRAFDNTQVYIKRLQDRIDNRTTASWALNVFDCWMSYRMSMLGAAFTTAVAMLVVKIDGITASLAGFVLSFALDFSWSIMSSVHCYTSCEIAMNAAERVSEYSKLTIEPQGGIDVPAAWPSEGRLAVQDLVIGYADDLPPVLRGLSFSIEKNERVGVVGRTGAGKSSLTLAIFRFLEARSGSIAIDGIDISKIKLHDLRSRLAIIPQDPELFTGTVRSNLDPFGQSTPGELKEALRRVHLVQSPESRDDHAAERGNDDANANIFENLSAPISEGGLNLSQGQRQLLCLARAIVSRPKIMILDEATSAVDMATDTLIQRSIREEFTNSTLIVIAHRLSTIADFDKVLVMSDGKAVEFGTPKELLDKKGAFYGLVEDTGEKEMLERLILGESDDGSPAPGEVGGKGKARIG